nr:nucleoside phosphorylase [Butyrivibrio sp.]
PDHDLDGIQLPEKCLFTFLGDVVHKYAKDNNAEVVEELITVSHNIKIYVLHEKDDDICLVQSTIGAPAAAQIIDSLVFCGCRKVIAVGSCGVLAQIPENAFIVPVKALRDEGTSYHYLTASRYIELDEEPIAVIERCFIAHDLPFVTCTTWTTDGFFRETKDMVKYRLEEGCSVVEMECAALANGTHTAYLVFDKGKFVGVGGVSYFNVMPSSVFFFENLLNKYLENLIAAITTTISIICSAVIIFNPHN